MQQRYEKDKQKTVSSGDSLWLAIMVHAEHEDNDAFLTDVE